MLNGGSRATSCYGAEPLMMVMIMIMMLIMVMIMITIRMLITVLVNRKSSAGVKPPPCGAHAGQYSGPPWGQASALLRTCRWTLRVLSGGQAFALSRCFDCSPTQRNPELCAAKLSINSASPLANDSTESGGFSVSIYRYVHCRFHARPLFFRPFWQRWPPRSH